MQNEVDYVEKAIADYTRSLGTAVVEARLLHNGRQNTIITVKDVEGTRSCVRYRTAVAFWYEDCVKEHFIESLNIVDAPAVRFQDDTVRPHILIREFVDGRLLHDMVLDNVIAHSVGRIMANYHISANGASHLSDFMTGRGSSGRWIDYFLRSLEDEAAACGYENSAIQELVTRCKTVFPSDTQENLVLIHNDLHLKNLIARPSGSVCVIDWDSAGIAPREKDFVKLLDWSHANAHVVPAIIASYEDKTGYKLNMEVIDIFRIYTCLRQMHFQSVIAQNGLSTAVLLQNGFFGNNEQQHRRMCEIVNKLGLSDWHTPLRLPHVHRS